MAPPTCRSRPHCAGPACCRVKRLEDLLAAAETLSRAKPARGDTLAIVSNAIGPGRLAADSVLREGPVPDAGSTHRIMASCMSPPPISLPPRSALPLGPHIGGVLVVHAPLGPDDEATIASLCHPPKDLRAPVLVCAMGETTGAMHRAILARAGLPVFATPDQACEGFEDLVSDRRNREAARELPASTVLSIDARARVGRAPLRRGSRLPAGCALTQDESLAILGAYGIPIVPTRFAAGPTDAGTAADLLGYPAVVKLRDIAAPADRPPGSLAFDLHDAVTHCRRRRAAVGPRPAAWRVGRTAGAARCRTRARGCDSRFGRRHVWADDRVRRRRHHVQSGRPGRRSAAIEPGVGEWPDPAMPHRRDARQTAARPTGRRCRGGGADCWCGSAS